MRAHFHGLDLALLAAYLAFTLVVGFWRRRQSAQGYLIADRRVGLPVFVATLVATWYGGILGVGEMTYRYGLINWTTQGLPYYLFAIVFALWLAPRVRSAALYTIPDKLEREYDRRTAVLGAVYAFLMATPAPYVLMAGQLLSVAFGWPLLPSMTVGLLFSVAYVYTGGFQSDVRINVFQFVLMFAGFAVALPIVAARTGSFHWLAAHVPADHLRLDGGLGIGYVAVWFFIALWTLVDPGFHQRCYAAVTPRVARNGILLAVACWAVFDFLTTSVGLYARAAMPDLPSEQAGLAFPLLAERLLPPLAKGLFYVAMLATVMSTVVSFTFLGAMTVGRDVLWRLTGRGDEERVRRLTRGGMVATSLLALAIAYALPSVVRQWWAIGTLFVPGMLLPVVTAYAPRWKVPPRWAFAGMLAGTGVAAGCLFPVWLRLGTGADVADSTLFPFGLQPMYPGLLAAVAVYSVGLLCGRRRRAGGDPATQPEC